tara:strand:- start:49 stop:1197 length:1149 start_codon:yes stop_codon:yes gene_type:complete
MKLYYWCPFFSNIATEKAVINSIVAIKKFSNNKIDPILLDVIGEWELQKKKLDEKKIKKTDLLSFKIIHYLPKYGFLKSRFSYFIVLFISIYKLHKKLKKDEPDFIVIHLMTFIPLLLLLIFNYKTKFILRISGYPKLNYLRTFLWKIVSKKLHIITTPTKSTMNLINDSKIFALNKVKYLPDPVLNLSDIRKKKIDKKNLEPELNSEKIIISIGRLTTQKNFEFLIKSFNNIIKTFPDYKLLILGDGEQKKKLKNIIKDLNLENKIFLLGYKKNIYKYLKIAKMFVLTSLWEDPGFVLIEAGYMNKTILSSDCPNGPNELLDYGNNGFLFKINSTEDFLKKFKEIQNLDEEELLKKQKNFKKKIKEFTLYNHYKILTNMLT